MAIKKIKLPDNTTEDINDSRLPAVTTTDNGKVLSVSGGIWSANNKPSYTLDEVADGSTRKLANYLPLAGGTMTGTIKWGGTAHNSDWTMSDYGIRTWNGYSSSSTVATGAPSNYSIGLSVRGGYQFTLAYDARSSYNHLTWRPGGTSNSYRKIWDSGNLKVSSTEPTSSDGENGDIWIIV